MHRTAPDRQWEQRLRKAVAEIWYCRSKTIQEGPVPAGISMLKPERKTRQEKIDRQLGRAGWALGSRKLIEEFIIEPVMPPREAPGVH